MFYRDEYDCGYDYISGCYIYPPDITMEEDYMDERWWYIDGAPGYMISDCGRVWSERTERFLKVKPMDREGHMGVCMSINGEPRYEYIHRLMAKAFIPNPHSLPVVRHLNDNPRDNALENLAWGTQRDNMHDALRNGKTFCTTPENRRRIADEQSIPIIAVNLTTGERLKFKGQTEAARVLGIHQANIWKVLNGERPRAQGYYFEYARRDEECD